MKGRWKKVAKIAALFVGILFVLAGISWRIFVAYASLEDVLHVDAVKDELQIRRDQFVDTYGGTVDFAEDDEINVLLLGLDARKGWESAHCDAIHMFTLNLTDWTMTITSVPRGTYSSLPERYADTEYYLANACGYGGLEYGIEQIEKTLGVRADYYATVGFSQVYGILRTFNLPTSDSLQWLRHRRSYAIGDPQRSHNQAVFMKDMILTQLGRFRSDVFKPMFLIVFNMLDTDMDIVLARSLLFAYLDADIDKRPDDIVLSMKPYHPDIQDLHFDFENGGDQIDELLERIRPVTSSEDLSDKSLEEYQIDLLQFLEDGLTDEEEFDLIVERQLWLQIEDHEMREEMHFNYLEAQVNALAESEINDAINLITVFIIEKETFGEDLSIKRAEDLMKEVIQ